MCTLLLIVGEAASDRSLKTGKRQAACAIVFVCLCRVVRLVKP